MAARSPFPLLLIAGQVAFVATMVAALADAKSDALRAALTEARSLLPVGENDPQEPRFKQVLQQKVAPLLPAVPVAGGAPKQYTRLPLNKSGATFDAFRFKAPAGGSAWNLSWEFVEPAPGHITQWFILPREGAMRGFTGFDRGKDYQEPGVKLPAKNRRFIQTLEGGALKPGKEYLIWFVFYDGQPEDVFVRLGVTPGKAAAPPKKAGK